MLVDEIVDGFRCMYVRMSISCMCGGQNVSGCKNKEGFSVASCSVVCQEVRGKFFSSFFFVIWKLAELKLLDPTVCF